MEAGVYIVNEEILFCINVRYRYHTGCFVRCFATIYKASFYCSINIFQFFSLSVYGCLRL